MPPKNASGGSAKRSGPTAAVRSAGRHQVEAEGEDEERLGGLLEGGLGEIGGGEVGNRDQRRGEDTPRPQLSERGERGQPGHHPDRDDLADEGLAEADPRHRGGGDREPVRAERVSRVRFRTDPAPQPLAPRRGGARGRC